MTMTVLGMMVTTKRGFNTISKKGISNAPLALHNEARTFNGVQTFDAGVVVYYYRHLALSSVCGKNVGLETEQVGRGNIINDGLKDRIE